MVWVGGWVGGWVGLTIGAMPVPPASMSMEGVIFC